MTVPTIPTAATAVPKTTTAVAAAASAIPAAAASPATGASKAAASASRVGLIAQNGRLAAVAASGSTAAGGHVLEHGRVLQHVGQDEESDFAAADIDVFQLRYPPVSAHKTKPMISTGKYFGYTDPLGSVCKYEFRIEWCRMWEKIFGF